MNKKFLRISAIELGIILLLLLLANFGLNFWLKNKLPDYIKNNSDYIVTYKNLDVDLGTGNVFSTGITINNKNPDNTEKIGLQGTVDTLSVARVGIFDFLFNDEISTSDLLLANPHLNISLPNAGKKKSKNKKQDKEISVKNIAINKGDIQVFKNKTRKFISVKDFNLKVENLEMNEETTNNKLPFTFDHYSIDAKDVFVRPDNVYAFTATYITTKEGQLSLKDFTIHPLLSYKNFRKFYPQKRNMFNVKTSEMEFKDIVLKDDKITLTKVRLEKPVIKMFTTNAKPEKKKKSFTYDVSLEDLIMTEAKIEILKPNQTPLFSANKLNLSVNKFLMNEESAKGNIPFQYNTFTINGHQVVYHSPTQRIAVAKLNILPKSVDLKTISVIPTTILAHKSSLDLTVKDVNLKIKEWNFIDNKLSLNIDNVLIDALRGKITSAKNPQKKKPANIEGIHYPLIVKNVELKNSDLTMESKSQPLRFHDLYARVQNIEMNAKTVKSPIPFQVGSYNVTSKNFTYKTKFYNLSTSFLKIDKNLVEIADFAMKPTVSRAQFIRMIPTEKDLYDLKVKDIKMTGTWDLVSANKSLHATQVLMQGMNAEIFRSKIPKDDLTKKPMYSKLLRSIKFPLFIDDLSIKNSLLIYEEDTKKSDGPGKLTFTDFNLNAKNINSGKMKGKPTKVPITINCKLMGSSPMKVNWTLDTASQSDAFTIAGTVTSIAAPNINAFTEPYLKVRATGLISFLDFDFRGNIAGIEGDFKMKHENLKIEILKADGEKNTILSGIANLFVKSSSDKFPEAVPVKNVERNDTKSFFNLLWQGIEQGLKRTLIGLNAPETEEKVKKGIANAKDAVKEVKTEVKEVKKDVKEEKKDIKKEVQEAKKEIIKDVEDSEKEVKKVNIFNKIFKKKPSQK